MFVNPLGWAILAVAAGLLVVGNLIIRRITAIV
jgi:Flp pilus assembly protein TadB